MITQCFICHESYQSSNIIPVDGRNVCRDCYYIVYTLFNHRIKCSIDDLISIATKSNIEKSIVKFNK